MIWYWEGDGRHDALWEAYREEDAAKLESTYQEFSAKLGDGTVVLQHGSTTYFCNVERLQQTNLDSGFVRKIHRGWPEAKPEEEDEEEEEDDNDDGDEDEVEEEEPVSDSRKARVEKLFENSDPKEMTDAAPLSYICPLAHGVMQDPVMTMVGSTYERTIIEEWLKSNSTDPLTNEKLSGSQKKLIPNRALRDSIQQWRKEYQQKKPQSPNKNSEEEDSKPPAKEDSKPAATPSTTANNNSSSTNPTTSQSTTPPVDVSNDLQEGEEREIQGISTTTSYTVKLLRGVYSCSCPAWRYAGGAIDTRSCKHLRQVRGTAAEEERLNPASTSNHQKKRKQPEPHSLGGQSICFTGALQTMTRVQAQAMARAAGASVTQSVTQATTVLVVGKRPGVKLSNSDASPACDAWTEDEFVNAATAGGTMPASLSGGRRLGGAARPGGSSPARATTTTTGDNGTIPPRVMLAGKFDEKANDPTGWLLSEKLDGMRAFWDGHAGKMWSRQGKAIYAPDWWTEALPRGMFLDGELWLGRGKFQECMSIARRQNQPRSWERITFLVFDAPDDVSASGRPNPNMEGYEERHKKASQAIEDAAKAAGTKSYARVHPFEICTGLTHLQQKLKEVEAIDGEGLMLRRSQSKYRGGRCADLLKVKSAHDDEAVVRGHESGRGRHVGRVGALQVVNKAGKRFKVGSGLTDQQRENPPPIGSVVTYRYNELTNAGVPRFPVFVRIRPDVEASDIAGS